MILYEGLSKINNIYIDQPKGAFYAFPRLPNGSIPSVEFCKKIINEFGLVVIPGLAFGDDQCIRISCAASKEKIKDGLSRLNLAIGKYY